jgi:hypothetical protein
LTATGIGQTENEARNQAVAEMSRIFESKVYSETNDRVRAVIHSSGEESSQQHIESNIRVMSEIKLKGVEVPEVWFDKEKRLYYARAVLDRFQARDSWLREIDDIDARIEGEFKALGPAESKFLKLKALKKILGLWIEREVIVSRLRVLGFQEGGSAAYDMKSVFQMMPELKKEMLIFVSVHGDHAGTVENEVTEYLGRAGYLMTDTRSRADVLITGEVRSEPVSLNNPGWKFSRAIVSLSIFDSATGSVVGEISENARAAQVTYEEAVTKAVKKVSEAAAEKLSAFLDE